MANTKISELENKGTLEDSDLIPIVDMSDEDNPATKNVKAGLIVEEIKQIIIDLEHPVRFNLHEF